MKTKDNVIDIKELSNLYMEIPRSENFPFIAKELGEIIKSLNITVKENDKLIDLIIKQVEDAEVFAFKTGIELGIKLSNDNTTE